ncbi:hypothetical protein Dda_0060 [Drechslerella dactyloides]|uniref:Uncharacterized protein n=1 Tax=Drechslerella dactyloides TaxID=74499 RepID=A0AAD6J3N4_DREDA|nr:hypothetical protein Dda_0060 [Drechslerella dactyloides]
MLWNEIVMTFAAPSAVPAALSAKKRRPVASHELRKALPTAAKDDQRRKDCGSQSSPSNDAGRASEEYTLAVLPMGTTIVSMELNIIQSWHSHIVRYESLYKDWLLRPIELDKKALLAQLEAFEKLEAVFQAYAETLRTLKWQDFAILSFFDSLSVAGTRHSPRQIQADAYPPIATGMQIFQMQMPVQDNTAIMALQASQSAGTATIPVFNTSSLSVSSFSPVSAVFQAPALQINLTSPTSIRAYVRRYHKLEIELPNISTCTNISILYQAVNEFRELEDVFERMVRALDTQIQSGKTRQSLVAMAEKNCLPTDVKIRCGQYAQQIELRIAQLTIGPAQTVPLF